MTGNQHNRATKRSADGGSGGQNENSKSKLLKLSNELTEKDAKKKLDKIFKALPSSGDISSHEFPAGEILSILRLHPKLASTPLRGKCQVPLGYFLRAREDFNTIQELCELLQYEYGRRMKCHMEDGRCKKCDDSGIARALSVFLSKKQSLLSASATGGDNRPSQDGVYEDMRQILQLVIRLYPHLVWSRRYQEPLIKKTLRGDFGFKIIPMITEFAAENIPRDLSLHDFECVGLEQATAMARLLPDGYFGCNPQRWTMDGLSYLLGALSTHDDLNSLLLALPNTSSFPLTESLKKAVINKKSLTKLCLHGCLDEAFDDDLLRAITDVVSTLKMETKIEIRCMGILNFGVLNDFIKNYVGSSLLIGNVHVYRPWAPGMGAGPIPAALTKVELLEVNFRHGYNHELLLQLAGKTNLTHLTLQQAEVDVVDFPDIMKSLLHHRNLTNLSLSGFLVDETMLENALRSNRKLTTLKLSHYGDSIYLSPVILRALETENTWTEKIEIGYHECGQPYQATKERIKHLCALNRNGRSAADNYRTSPAQLISLVAPLTKMQKQPKWRRPKYIDEPNFAGLRYDLLRLCPSIWCNHAAH